MWDEMCVVVSIHCGPLKTWLSLYDYIVHLSHLNQFKKIIFVLYYLLIEDVYLLLPVHGCATSLHLVDTLDFR